MTVAEAQIVGGQVVPATLRPPTAATRGRGASGASAPAEPKAGVWTDVDRGALENFEEWMRVDPSIATYWFNEARERMMQQGIRFPVDMAADGFALSASNRSETYRVTAVVAMDLNDYGEVRADRTARRLGAGLPRGGGLDGGAPESSSMGARQASSAADRDTDAPESSSMGARRTSSATNRDTSSAAGPAPAEASGLQEGAISVPRRAGSPQATTAGSSVSQRSRRGRGDAVPAAFLDSPPAASSAVTDRPAPVASEPPVAHPTHEEPAPVASEPQVAHPTHEETVTTPSDPVGGRSEFSLGGLPAGIGWGHARLVHSWDSEPGTTETTSLYEAFLAASDGRLPVDDTSGGRRVISDAGELRQFVAQGMGAKQLDGQSWQLAKDAFRQAASEMVASAGQAENLDNEVATLIEEQIDTGVAWGQMVASFQSQGHWDALESALAPVMLSEYSGTSLLVLHADGRMSSYGSGPALVVAQSVGPDGTQRWVGVPSRADGQALGGLSGGQVKWAADHGMAFVGDHGGSDFFDALAAAGRGAGLGESFGDGQALRTALTSRMRMDTSLDDPDSSVFWANFEAEYVRATVRDDGSDQDAAAPRWQEIAKTDAGRRVYNGEAWQEIIAQLSGGRDHGLTDGLLRLLGQRYFEARVLETDAQPLSPGEEPGLTVARLTGDGARSWTGLAPVRAPHVRGAVTSPADVAGGRSSTYVPVYGPATSGPVMPTGREPEGMTAAQWRSALRHDRQVVEVHKGADAFFNAVLAATGEFGAGQVPVEKVTELRGRLVERIDQEKNGNPDGWLVVYTIYAELYKQREQSGPQAGAENDVHALDARISERIESGQALDDIKASIADPGSWPELAEQIAPYFMNRLGSAVRVIETTGEVSRYGNGRPLYVAHLHDTKDGVRRWAALPWVERRFAVGSPLSAPNRSDPVLVGLGLAADAQRAAQAKAGSVDSADSVLKSLQDARNSWLANGAGSSAPSSGVSLEVADLESAVDRLRPADDVSAARGRGDAVAAGLNLGSAVRLISRLFEERGGIRPAPTAGRTGDAAATGEDWAGIRADQWVVARSLRELIGAIPAGSTALFVSGGRTWVVADTTSGRRLVEFSPANPAGSVMAPSPRASESMSSAGLAVVVGEDGHVMPVNELVGPFVSAVGWDSDDIFAPGSFHQASAADGPWTSERQREWALVHERQFDEPQQGDNAFFEATIKAAGGRLTVGGKVITDPAVLRTELAEWIGTNAAELSKWPLVPAGYGFAGGERVLEEFLRAAAEFDSAAVHRRMVEHFETGMAAQYIERAIAQPGHWEEAVRLLAPPLLAEAAGVRLTILEHDGSVLAYEPAGASQAGDLVLARTNPRSATTPLWSALVGEAGKTLPRIDADKTIRITAGPSTGQPATLSGHQQNIAGTRELEVQPTEAGADSIYSAVLAAMGGGVLLDRGTFVDTPSQLREGLARSLRERPDVLGRDARGQIDQSDEEIISALTDPVARNTDGIARHLIAPYLGVELSIVEREGEIRADGGGRSITLAPTGSVDNPHWAALVPSRSVSHDIAPVGLLGLPKLPLDADQPQISNNNKWSRDGFELVEPEAREVGSPWRNATFCLEDEDGNMACVSVAVVYQRLPL
ncbi:hypothetical protein NE236_10045 [Actinoallomurus purpureus]|uniref:hypothetical protein n=1 Tax=Actinoallomurus purpureus TaxID=478114 RepID=UPI0020932560|nr:hypothetical protein [Actinoallomurus purpureus]MCO6005325.1 hypothetical protein [Actinoallomurus purpureus]